MIPMSAAAALRRSRARRCVQKLPSVSTSQSIPLLSLLHRPHPAGIVSSHFSPPPPSRARTRRSVAARINRTPTRMPVLLANSGDDGVPGPLTPKTLVLVVVAVVLCSSAIAAFCMLSKWGKQCRQRTKPREHPPASDTTPALPRRGGATHPTASPRKWKFWRKASAADDVYGDARGGRDTPLSLPDASSSHSRSASVLSGTSSLTAGHAFPVVSVVTSPPAARIVELPHNTKPSL